MSALHVEHLEHIGLLDSPECRLSSTTPNPRDRVADPGASAAPGAPSTPSALGEPRRPIDLSPISAYEIVTRQMIEATQRDVAEIKGRINNLMVMVCGAVLVNIILRMAGLG